MYKRTGYIVLLCGLLLGVLSVVPFRLYCLLNRDAIWLARYQKDEKAISRLYPIGSFGRKPGTVLSIVRAGTSYIDIIARFGTPTSADAVAGKLLDTLSKHGLSGAQYKILRDGSSAVIRVSYSCAAPGRTYSSLNVPVYFINKAFSETNKSIVLVTVPIYALSYYDSKPIRLTAKGSLFNGAQFVDDGNSKSKGRLITRGELTIMPYSALLLLYIVVLIIPLIHIIWSYSFLAKNNDQHKQLNNYTILIMILNIITVIMYMFVFRHAGLFFTGTYTDILSDLWFGSPRASDWFMLTVPIFPIFMFIFSLACEDVFARISFAESLLTKGDYSPDRINRGARRYLIYTLSKWVIAVVCLVLFQMHCIT